MSRRDRAQQVAVDFSAPRPPKRARPLAALLLAVVMMGALAIAVTQLLLR